MKRLTRYLALLLFALLALKPASAHAVEVEVLRQSGPPEARFNLVLLGDGYRSTDQAQLSADAKKLMDYLFAASPFKEYASFFNVKLVHVISNQNGADNGAFGAQRDTALGAYFNCKGTPRLLCVDEKAVEKAATENVKEVNLSLVIVNDTTYGGSGGSHPATSIGDDSFEIVAHEIGHSMAGLADEYDAATPGYPPCDTDDDCKEGNVTLRNTRAQVKWRAWIAASTPVPTPASNANAKLVGLFEGARYLTSGVYRSAENCKMRELGQPYCSVCTEQLVLGYWNLPNIQMIESATPASPLQSSNCKPIALSVSTPGLNPSTFELTWTVDGKTNPEASATLQLQPTAIGAGAHTVNLLVHDKTAYVRTDPQNLLQDQHTWNLDVTTEGCPVTGGGGTGGVSASGGQPTVGSAGAESLQGGTTGAVGGQGGGLAVAGAPASAGAAPTGSAGSAQAPPPPESVQCNCTVPHAPAGGGSIALSLLALAVALARRRSTPLRQLDHHRDVVRGLV